jgi:CRP/FNR family transcriptional regulator, cyclic AMP receptor protein
MERLFATESFLYGTQNGGGFDMPALTLRKDPMADVDLIPMERDRPSTRPELRSGRTLAPDERKAIDSGGWFSSLSPMLRHDILRHGSVLRLHDGEQIGARGDPAQEWLCCARGAVRISADSGTGRSVSLCYLAPGAWFGDVSLLDGGIRTHDAHARGRTSLLMVPREDFNAILLSHPEFAGALLRLQARRVRNLYGLVDDMYTQPRRVRLAKTLLQLARSHGGYFDEPETDDDQNLTVISLRLLQEEIASLLGASRQRVNKELRAFQREGAIRLTRGRLAVVDRKLIEIIESGTRLQPSW